MNDKLKQLKNVSNPYEANRKALYYYNQYLSVSERKDKKYKIYDPYKEKWVHFGHIKYQDFTKHKDEERRQRYLKRASHIKGDWKDNIYSPNVLSMLILW